MKKKADCASSLACFDLFNARIQLKFGEKRGFTSCVSLCFSILFLLAAPAIVFSYLRKYMDSPFESIVTEQLIPQITPEIAIDNRSAVFRLFVYHEERGNVPLDFEDIERFIRPVAFYLPPDGNHRQDSRLSEVRQYDLVPCSNLDLNLPLESLNSSEDQTRGKNGHLEKALCIDDSKSSEFRLGGQLFEHFQGTLAIHLLPCSLDKKECTDASEVSKLKVMFSLQNSLPNFSSSMNPMTSVVDYSDQITLNLQFAPEHFIALQRTEVLGNGLFFSTLEQTDQYTRIFSKRFNLISRDQVEAQETISPSSKQSFLSLYLGVSSQVMQVKRRSLTFIQCFRDLIIDLTLIFTVIQTLTNLYHEAIAREVMLSQVFNIDSTSNTLYKAGCEKLAESLDIISLLRDLSTVKFLLEKTVSEDVKPASAEEVLKLKVDLFRSSSTRHRPETAEIPTETPRFAAFDSGQPTPFRPKRLGRILNSNQQIRKPVLRGSLPKAVNYSIEVPNSGRSSMVDNIL